MVLTVVARGDHPEGAGDPEIWAAQDRRSQMAKIAALAGLLVLMPNIVARADPSYAVWADQSYIVWRLAHERLLAKWRASEPRCGWTAGGYACSSRKRSGYAPIWIRG
jgi:hypothetical protein